MLKQKEKSECSKATLKSSIILFFEKIYTLICILVFILEYIRLEYKKSSALNENFISI